MDWSVLYYLAIALVINLAMFLVAFKKQTDSSTDISYAVTFAVLVAVGVMNSSVTLAHTVVAAMVCLWAARLGGFLLYRIRKTGRDHRFDDMRSDFMKFLQFWVLQGVSVWVILIPTLLLFQNKSAEMPVLSIVGVGIWLLGLVTEAVADLQKFRFTRDPAHKNEWIDEGVWKYSRHPNYFGEICIWLGVYMFAVPSLGGWQMVVGLVSPVFIASLLLFVSGIPKLEKSADDRWGSDKAYQEYKRRTSLLIPWPKKPPSQ